MPPADYEYRRLKDMRREMEARSNKVPVIRLTQDECIVLEDDWDTRAANAGLSADMTVLVGMSVTQGLVLETGAVIVGANQLRALYRVASRAPRVEPVLRRIESTGMSVVDLLGGIG